MIPREIDELMWNVAESGDHDAISEFGDRYPIYRDELLKRMRTVQALKAGGRTTRHDGIPTFRNTSVKPANWRIIFATFAATVLMISAFGLWRLNRTINPPEPVKPVHLQATNLPDANIQYGSENNPQNTPPAPRPVDGSNNQPYQPPINPPVVKSTDLISQPGRTTVQLESASLHAAITMIAEAGHMQVTIAQGTPDPVVKIDYQDMTPMEMLKAMGKEYAFDILVDGERAILIIPKKDEDDGQMTNESH